jgi:hypothetical protein
MQNVPYRARRRAGAARAVPLVALIGGVVALAPVEIVAAQTPPPAYEQGGPEATVPPAPQRRIRLDLDVGVPLFVSTGRLDPGVSGSAQIGYDLGVVVPIFRVGYMWNPINADFATSTDITRLSASLGVRFEIGGDGPVLLYLAPMVDLNIWHPTGTLQMRNCRAFYCSLSGDDWDPSPGVSLSVGGDLRPFGSNRFGLGFGILGALNFAAGPLPDPAFWIQPFVRGTVLF